MKIEFPKCICRRNHFMVNNNRFYLLIHFFKFKVLVWK
jgi:hypothetical protein